MVLHVPTSMPRKSCGHPARSLHGNEIANADDAARGLAALNDMLRDTGKIESR